MSIHLRRKLLRAAAMPTLERIRRDFRQAPQRLRPLLAHLEKHLFDPELDAGGLLRACGVRDNTMSVYFHSALGLSPYAYIEDCRMEVACRLLRETDLKVWQVAQLLGYSTLQVFSRAFDRWAGMRPSVFRRRSRNLPERPELDDGHGDDEGSALCLETLLKAARGRLRKHEADELSRELAKLYPESFQASETCAPAVGN